MNSFNFGKADAMETNTIAEVEEEGGMPSSIDIFIPVEILENILSRLPVKSLIRFKSTCKFWHTMISNNRFCQIHYDMTHKNDLYWMRPHRSTYLNHLAKVDSKEVRTLWLLKSPFDESVIPNRTCNGIVLMVDDRTSFMGLWNPSIRKHYCWIKAPPEHRDKGRIYGFYYDPIIDDYKIAVISPEYYSIYSCKSASWGETKPFPSAMPARLPPQHGFNINGSSSFYWLDEELGEIVCFDFRDEKLSKLPLPAGVTLDACYFHLAAMSGGLCLLGTKRSGLLVYQLWVMEMHNHSWRELIGIEKGEPPRHMATPYILTNEDSVVVSLELKMIPRVTKFLFYCLHDKRLKDFSSYIAKAIHCILPYSESLNFPVPEIIPKKKQGTECETSG